MEIKAEQKYVRVAPRKLRLVADMVRKLEPSQALEVLPFVEKRGAAYVGKVLKTALANARDRGLSDENMRIKSLQIAEGPRLKRFRPVSRGRAHGYKKRMSHIRIVLEERKENKQDTSSKKQTDKKSK